MVGGLPVMRLVHCSTVGAKRSHDPLVHMAIDTSTPQHLDFLQLKLPARAVLIFITASVKQNLDQFPEASCRAMPCPLHSGKGLVAVQELRGSPEDAGGLRQAEEGRLGSKGACTTMYTCRNRAWAR